MINRNQITQSVIKLTDNKFKKQIERSKWKVQFPDIKDIVKRRLFFKPKLETLKVAEKSNYITQTLKDRLNKDLKETLKRVPKGTKLNQRLVKEFKSRITDTFKNYTKKDPKYKMPPNIRNISVTEMKSAISNVRKVYIDDLLKRNPDLEYLKEWHHYKSYSKEYRRGHAEKHLERRKMNEKFKVNEYKKVKGRWIKTGKVIEMDRPHDKDADAGEVIGCSCELKYILKKKKIFDKYIYI
jgi:hypothetical protein